MTKQIKHQISNFLSNVKKRLFPTNFYLIRMFILKDGNCVSTGVFDGNQRSSNLNRAMLFPKWRKVLKFLHKNHAIFDKIYENDIGEFIIKINQLEHGIEKTIATIWWGANKG
jgi:hypothetical protein